MFKKALLFAASVLSLAPVANAYPRPDAFNRVAIVDCDAVRSGPDFGTGVTIESVRHGRGIAQLQATVTSQSIAGPRVIGQYFVRQLPMPPHRMGAPVVYRGMGFELEVNFTTSPIGGRHLGRMVAEVHGQRVVEQMMCRNVR
jgi:hypothetical protein